MQCPTVFIVGVTLHSRLIFCTATVGVTPVHSLFQGSWGVAWCDSVELLSHSLVTPGVTLPWSLVLQTETL